MGGVGGVSAGVRSGGVAAADRIAPWRRGAVDPRFWLVQGLVVAIFVANEVLTGPSGSSAAGRVTDLAVEALFLAPILYAALNFGVPGSLATAAGVSLLVIGGDLSVDLVNRRLADAASDVVMLALLDAVALFVAWRVSVEHDARSRYFSLFEIGAQPVFLLDASDRVLELNAAARQLLSAHPAPAAGRPLASVLGVDAGELTDGATLSVPSAPGEYRLVTRRLAGRSGNARQQVVLEEVDAQRRKEREARTFARQLLRAQEEERRRVAQEIHDGPVQCLVQLCRQLDRVDETPGLPDTARSGLADSRAVAELAVEELRDLLRGLRPPALEHLGLVPTLRRLVEAMPARSGIRSHLIVDGPERRLGAEVELAAFRIGQEALTNVERHAGATSVTVTCRFRAAALELVVADDGRGLAGDPRWAGSRWVAGSGAVQDPGGEVGPGCEGGSGPVAPPAAGSGAGGLGLRGMAERAELVGGRVEVSAGRRRGTVVRATLPLAVGACPGG